MFQNLLDADVERISHMAVGDASAAHMWSAPGRQHFVTGGKVDASLPRPDLAPGFITLPSA